MRLFKIVFFASVILFLFSLTFHNIIEFDQDLGRHLLMGKIISSDWTVPKSNLLSYSFPNFQFINSHWLSEMIFHQVDKIFGITSLLILKVAVLTTAFSLTVFTAYRYSKNLLATALAFAVFAPVLLERTEIRPEMFSFLFVAVFVYILFCHSDKYAQRTHPESLLRDTKAILDPARMTRIVWALPIIELFWVNMHIYFILGPILAGIFLVQRMLDAYKISRNVYISFRNTKYEILNTVFVCTATLFNPNFLSGALYPFRVFDNYGYSIVENQNIFFLKDVVFNPNILYFGIAIGAFVLSLVLTDWKKIRLHTVLLTGLAILSFMAIRNFPLLFLIELPVLAGNLANLNPILRRRLLYKKSSSAISSLTAAIVILAISLTLWRSGRLITNEYYLSIDSHKRFGSQVAESGKGALDFVIKNNLRGPIFNNFDIGSYVAYRLYPKEKVFVDGRPEAYPAQFFQNIYIPMQMSAENFNQADSLYKFNLIIFSHTDATPWAQNFLSEIVKNPEYRLVYLDSYAIVFVKKSKFPDLPVVTAENIKTNRLSYLDNLSYAQIFSTFGWNELVVKFLQLAYAQNPNSRTTVSALGQVYSQNPTTAILGQKYLEEYRERNGLVLF